MTETSTETLTERLKRQETERADAIQQHAEQCSERVKRSTTQQLRDAELLISKNTARIRTLLKTNLFYSCLVAPVLALLIVLPVTWTGGQVLLHLLEKELEATQAALEKANAALVEHEQAMQESMMTIEPWGVTPWVTRKYRYLRIPGKAKPEVVPSKSGADWFVKIGPAPKSR